MSMGKTANAVLVAGFIGAAMQDNEVYETTALRPDVGGIELTHRLNGNVYLVTVEQLSGIE